MKDRNLFLNSETTPRTFNALEAKLGTKNQKKKYNEVDIEATTSRLKKNKNKLKEKMGCLPTSAFL